MHNQGKTLAHFAGFPSFHLSPSFLSYTRIRQGIVMDGKINLAIVEENRLYRESLRSVLNQIADFHIVRDEDTVDDILQNLADQIIDIVLLSIDVGRPKGFDALKQLRRLFPQLNILVLLDYPETCYYEHAVTEGANDAIPKFSGKSVIEQHVRSIIEKSTLSRNEATVRPSVNNDNVAPHNG